MSTSDFYKIVKIIIVTIIIINSQVLSQDYNLDTTNTYIDDLIDIYHPKSFIRMYESFGKGEINKILIQSVENIPHEVDIDSRIEIEFDRSWIILHRTNFEADISIEGQIKGKNEIRKFEIPGYSMVGTQSTSASASLRSYIEMFGLLNEIHYTYNKFYENYSTIILTLKYKNEIKNIDKGELEQFNGLRTDIINQKQRIKSVLEKINSDSKKTMLKFLIRNLRDITSVMDADALVSDSKTIVDSIIPSLIKIDISRNNYQDTLIPLLSSFIKSLNRLDMIGAEFRQDEITQKINQLDYEISSSTDSLKMRDKNKLTIMKESLSKKYLERVYTDLLGSLRNTNFLVSETGAREGDEIWITIRNGDSSVYRSMTIRLIVKEFGLIKKVNDSFFLLKQTAIGTPNFTPAPGVSLTWTSHPRDHKGGWFLQPGFGINISFPHFSNSSSIDVAAGGILSAFDNAVALTVGFCLTSGELASERSYVGLGFSFLNIAQKIGATQ